MNAILTSIQRVAQENSTSILTGVGVAGTISTAVLASRATVKAVRELDSLEEQFQIHLENNGLQGRGMTLGTRTKLGSVWKFYIPPTGVGLITVSAIVLANRVAGKEAAALAAAYAVSEKALTEYREQVVKKLGQTKDEEFRDGVAEARMSNNPVNSREVILAGTGEVLCFDILSGRYFQSSQAAIERAENDTNLEVVNFMHCSLSHFYEQIGLPPTGFSDTMGFNPNRRCRVRFSTQLSSDGRPCLAIDFIEDPILNYHKLWD